jgi:hypothetical protein
MPRPPTITRHRHVALNLPFQHGQHSSAAKVTMIAKVAGIRPLWFSPGLLGSPIIRRDLLQILGILVA